MGRKEDYTSRKPDIETLKGVDESLLEGTIGEFWVDAGMFRAARNFWGTCANHGLSMSMDKFEEMFYRVLYDYLVDGRKTVAPEHMEIPKRWWAEKF